MPYLENQNSIYKYYLHHTKKWHQLEEKQILRQLKNSSLRKNIIVGYHNNWKDMVATKRKGDLKHARVPLKSVRSSRKIILSATM
jgi:hypothetical protein